jgi:malate dehydrogenase (oxaloacetate-decarboxylating)(NADP+)
MIVRQMQSEGNTFEEACSKIFLMDVDGYYLYLIRYNILISSLITTSRKNIETRHLPFAKEMQNTKNLLEVVDSVKPGALIGASTVRGAFSDAVIQKMAEINARPIIFALSNPTSKAECTAEAAYRITHVNLKINILNCF